MTRFLVRVELFDAGYQAYETLYEEMEKYGFSKDVLDENRKVFELPNGTYTGESIGSAEDVRSQVSAIADLLSSKPASVFVCAFTEWDSYLYPR